MVSVDGTDLAVPQFKPFWKGSYRHKLNGPGTQWEVGLCICSHGHWPDLKIFCHAVISYLDDGEKAEADDGYLGEPTKALIPKVNTITPANPEL